ncbi:glutamine--fructose-6-phosphate transaminase (isomerizing) [Methanothermobacter tenebrarum]|uniref:Glutamine--fructose-6-phosphate aminotransferase [isomerizing] n=1 Tax=Methanothermobacter tenebrarum TaxID=680118 RepID=A0A328P9A9_9EURY|nr:glutamine--fructose-6-phosphate transaminase (isomerizing) [Methanothermobacter tenebrarum]MBC7117942.1 glutamine--fructose-6-phosphate transaminase (isomerizing) [Methanobacteriaceae archaeon]NPV64590.1 glutamine--fructose-6-phosphate transaminase (isomerizing) [Methanobacteriaceae archaeon]RAO78679.1 glutamine--fructose-6-phosphate transaminase (isomerizing) [Methanothermobacter tenebrarum]
MCGIAACMLKNGKAAPILLGCVKRLEYRGYDSVGIATLDSSIIVEKDKGKIKDFEKYLDLSKLPGRIGLGHVRWATHGPPTKENAHPHLDCEGKIAVVHNGIISNYEELKDELKSEGHKFTSETDTEVIAHLIEKYKNDGHDLEEAVKRALKRLKGSYAMAVISSDEPDKIIGARKENPLIVAKGDSGYFLASDIPAILEHARNVIFLEDNEMVIIDDTGHQIKDLEGKIKKKEFEYVEWTLEMAEKGGYKHFMLKEIYEQPQVLRDTLREFKTIQKVVDEIGEIKRICFVACGTSYHAALVGKYLFESILHIPTDAIIASEFQYTANTLDEETLAIFITQSGETADTLNALKAANKNSKTLAIVNVIGSTATREADHVIYTRAGPEIAVAATKTYICQLACIYMLAAAIGKKPEIMEDLKKVPEEIEKILREDNFIKEIAKTYKDKPDFLFIGRGFSYPTALEGALKLKEITYIHAEGYASGELKHGPIALIEDGVPVVAIAPPPFPLETTKIEEDEFHDSHSLTLGNIEEVKSRGAKVIGLGAEDDEEFKKNTSAYISFNPSIREEISPLLYIIPLQLLAYHISVMKKEDPDHPRNLAKCVTVD